MRRTRNPFILIQHAFSRRFDHLRVGYSHALDLALNNRRGFSLVSLCWSPALSRCFRISDRIFSRPSIPAR